VTDESSPNYVSPEARIAVYDNDGALWCLRRHIVGTRFVGHLYDKVYNCLFCGCIIPRCKMRCHFNSFRE
jgi:hypothetical protein